MSKFLRFMCAGIPAFLVAFGLNYLLVTQLAAPKPLAYALALIVQLGINFFICRYFVFAVHPTFHAVKSFLVFFNGVAFFRLLDWGLYVLLTSHFHFPFWAVQLFNIALFSILRFEFSRSLFERKP